MFASSTAAARTSWTSSRVCGALTVSGHRRIRVEVESELSGVSFGFAEVNAGTFGGDLSEFVGSGIGDEEVGGQRRVSADVGDVESDRREGFDLELRRVEDERSGSQSGASRARNRLSRLGEVDDPGLPGFGGDGEDAGLSVTEFEARIGIEREDIVVGDMTEQRIDVDGLDGGLPCRCGVGLSAGGLGEDRCEALAEGLEFELIEQARQFAGVPFSPDEVVEAQTEIDVVEEAVESVVPLHLGDVIAQLLTDLAADLLRILEHTRQVTVCGEPFGGCLVTDAGDTGQVVGLLADERGQTAIVGRT